MLARLPDPAQPYLDQVDRVFGKVADAVIACSVSLADLEGAAAQLCQLTKQARGSSPIPAEKFRGSERALCDLRALGSSLAVELWRFQRLQEEERRLAQAGHPRAARP